MSSYILFWILGDSGFNINRTARSSSTAVTLEDILEHCKIRKGDLDKQCSEEHLLKISERVSSSWELYAPDLGLSDDIESLRADHSHQTTVIQSRAAFKLWEEREAFRATYLHLVENVFLKHRNAKMATFVCELLVQ